MLLNSLPLEWKLIGTVVLAGALVSGAATYRHHVYRLGFDAAVTERASRDTVAVLRRTQDNAALSAKQASINTLITKAKYEEIAPVRERIVTQRVYVGSAICGSAAAAPTEVSTSGDGASPPGRLVRQDVERDIVALKLAVEEDLATARACQAAAREHGLVQ